MIIHIFYSLVLFPVFRYDQIGKDGFYLVSVFEKQMGTMGIIFSAKGRPNEYVYFTHKTYLGSGEKASINNWKIEGENQDLISDIVNQLEQVDAKRDFHFFNEKKHNRSIPFGVVLTITSKCNIFCYYCFNDIDYDLKHRNTRKNHDVRYWKNIIDHLHKHGTRVVILTGGEPMVAPFFWDLLEYLQRKNMFVHINTNGTVLQDKILEKLGTEYSVNIMVSMHEFNNKDYYQVNQKGLEMTFDVEKVPKKFKTLFTDKLEQLRKIRNYPNLSLEFLTILVWKNILNLDKIYEFGKTCGVDFHAWQFFRLYSTKNNTGATRPMMDLAVNKMYLLNKKYGVDYKIVDPVPFCVTKNVQRSQAVIDGVLSDSHDVKTIITTEGYVQMMSAYDNNFWNIGDTPMSEIFSSEFVKKQLNNGFLPTECENCKYKEECRGGSRMDANIVNGGYGEFDPIGDVNNKVVI